MGADYMFMNQVSWGARSVVSGAFVVALVATGAWLFLSVAGGLPGTGGEDTGRDSLLVAAALEGLLAVVAVWYAVARARCSLASLGFAWPRSRHPLALAVVGWLAGLALVQAWSIAVDRMGWDMFRPADRASEVIGIGADLWLTYAVVAVAAPFCEEVFFRGFAYAGLRRTFGLPIGVLTSAALFAAFHLDITTFVPIALFGIVLAWVYIQSGSIWPPMLAHALNNAVALSIAVVNAGA
jgi:membrane protease YdiL (CAAX protease family)